jgi:hypothetical protein
MSCNNSSNINLTKTYITITQGGSRLMVNIPDSKCATGVTYGSVIRYDPTANLNTGQYKLSNASSIVTSEVVGIVESINTDSSKNVVIYGSINLPASAIENIPTGYDGGSGGSDIYFLSPTSSGKVRNSAPSNLDHVVKPLYQKAPHGNGSYTGIVMNYIGYKIDGVDISSATSSYNGQQTLIGSNVIDPDSNSGMGLIKLMLVDPTNSTSSTPPDTYLDMSVSHVLPLADWPDYWAGVSYVDWVYVNNNSVASLPSPLSRLFIEKAIPITHTVSSSNIGKYLIRSFPAPTANGNIQYSKITGVDVVNNAYLLSHNNTSKTAYVTRTFGPQPGDTAGQPTWTYGISNAITFPTSYISGASSLKFSSVTAYGVHTPKITYNGTITDSTTSSVIPNAKVIVLMKVKSDIQGATESFTNNTFQSSSLTLNNENVKDIVSDIETRLQAVETRLSID